MYSRGDPELDRELQAEIDQRSRWRRDLLLLLGVMVIVLAIMLLSGFLDPAPASSRDHDERPAIAMSAGELWSSAAMAMLPRAVRTLTR